jgi:hypothetical protein
MRLTRLAAVVCEHPLASRQPRAYAHLIVCSACFWRSCDPAVRPAAMPSPSCKAGL